TVQPAGREAGRRVLDVLPAPPPVLAPRLVGRVGSSLAASFDDQESSLHPGVLGLVPLVLLVAYEAPLVRPVRGIRAPGPIEFIGPDEPIAIRGRLRVRGGD